jgi:hypothetical protein
MSLSATAEMGCSKDHDAMLKDRPWLSFYLGMALLTALFQIWWRSSQCVGLDGCGPSFAKAIAWGAIWPASWIVLFAGI